MQHACACCWPASTHQPSPPVPALRPPPPPAWPACLQVGSIVNFALMYLLAPVAASGGAAKQLGLVQKVFGDHYLAKWGAPPGHLFQPGYPLGKRLVNFAYKGTVFAFIGMCAGLVGTATSNGLLELRKKLDPGFTSPVSRGAARRGAVVCAGPRAELCKQRGLEV